MKTFEIVQIHKVDHLYILLSSALQLKAHYFNKEQQNFFSLPEKSSQKSRTAFPSYLIEVYGQQITKSTISP